MSENEVKVEDSTKNNEVVDANDLKAGDVRQSVGRFWRVVIDAAAKSKDENSKYKYFVPLECKIGTAKQLPFGDSERQFAIPSNFPNKHRFLPQRLRPKLAPRNLGYGSLVKSKDDIKTYKELKTEAQQYLKQKRKYCCAKQNYEQAKKEMEKCMGILSKDEIKKYATDKKVVENQIKNAKKKVQEYKESITTNKLKLQEAKNLVQNIETELNVKKENGNHDVQLIIQNLERQRRYVQECTIYGHELQKNLNLVRQAIKCCENEYKKLHDLYHKAREIRDHYKKDEDLNDARKDFKEAEHHLNYLTEKRTQIQGTIVWCKGKTKKETTEGGAILGGYNPQEDITFARAESILTNLRKTEQNDSIKKQIEESQNKIIEKNLPFLIQQKKELDAMIEEAKDEVQKKQTLYEELRIKTNITAEPEHETISKTPPPVGNYSNVENAVKVDNEIKIDGVVVALVNETKDDTGKSFDKNGLSFTKKKDELTIEYKDETYTCDTNKFFPQFQLQKGGKPLPVYKIIAAESPVDEISCTNNDKLNVMCRICEKKYGYDRVFKKVGRYVGYAFGLVTDLNAIVCTQVGIFDENYTNFSKKVSTTNNVILENEKIPQLCNGYKTFTAYKDNTKGVSLKYKDGKVIFAYIGPITHAFLPHGYGRAHLPEGRKLIGRWFLGDVVEGSLYTGTYPDLSVNNYSSYVHGKKGEILNKNNEIVKQLQKVLDFDLSKKKQLIVAENYAQNLLLRTDPITQQLKENIAYPYNKNILSGGIGMPHAPVPPIEHQVTNTYSPLLNIAQKMHTITNLKGGGDLHTKKFKMQELSKLHLQAGEYVKHSNYTDMESKMNFVECAKQALEGGSHFKILGKDLSQHLLSGYY